MILIIDNFDSFTYNLFQAVAPLTDDVQVVRNNAITINEIIRRQPMGIILSPGPKHPHQAGICIDIIQKLCQHIPILGVCLGHQAIAAAFGGIVGRAHEQIHGRDSLIFHNHNELFKNMALPFKAARYHSLIVETNSLPQELSIIATDSNNSIMALKHKQYPIYGVQFHPESILTPEGDVLLNNFVEICATQADKLCV
jgi:anthranilate synthase/aminodeoxychorismate synthase-like glutamine amidotransferase